MRVSAAAVVDRVEELAVAFQWYETYFVNTDPFVHSPEGWTDPVGTIFLGNTLVRTLLWWDVRYYVAEDHTQVPRAPIPWTYGVYVTPSGPPPDQTGDRSDPILRGLLSAYPSEAYGTKNPTAELVERTWVGNSGPNPVESHGKRKMRGPDQSESIRIYFEPLHRVVGVVGEFSAFPLTIQLLVRTLVEYPDPPAATS